MVTQTQKMGIGKEVTAMYLATPPPDDLEQARSCESLRTHVAAAMALCPDRFRLHGRRKARHVPPVRKGSDDPLRLVPKQRTRRRPEAAGPGSAAAQEAAAEALLRELLTKARQRGVTLEILAERAGYSERTLRRRLKAPETLPLGEFCRISRAAQEACAEGGRHG